MLLLRAPMRPRRGGDGRVWVTGMQPGHVMLPFYGMENRREVPFYGEANRENYSGFTGPEPERPFEAEWRTYGLGLKGETLLYGANIASLSASSKRFSIYFSSKIEKTPQKPLFKKHFLIFAKTNVITSFMQTKVLFHGSDKVINHPVPGGGNPYNDYGPGFYCTQNRDLAMEWACKETSPKESCSS